MIDTICLAKRNGSSTPAHPIAWHETADEWVIVYEDGRKLRHSKSEPHDVPIDTVARQIALMGSAICLANHPSAATPAKAAGEWKDDPRRSKLAMIRPQGRSNAHVH